MPTTIALSRYRAVHYNETLPDHPKLRMALAAGTRLGPYEVVSALGAGGMGEVYRARDTKLNRDVALKILPESFTHDPERIARFRREAQVLASFNHPHIGAIYGLDEANDQHFLVLELIDGETLADRVVKGPLPVDEALAIAKQIAEALEAAHEKGIIHRDLKPANIALTKEGNVKVLDFGLAKATEAASGLAVDLPNSPTLTSPAVMTGVGMILGTAAYMSPEQAKGRPADKRSDIWAFGCVLYEMLTGTRTFDAEDVSDTVAFVLTKEPDWNTLPSSIVPAIRVLLQRCLQKDRRQRIADISTAVFVLNEATSLSVSGPPDQSAAMWRHVAIVGTAMLVLGLTVAGGLVWLAMRPAPPRVTRLTIAATGPAAPTIQGADRDLALTRDGSRIIYVGANSSQLLVRPLDQLEPTTLATGRPRGVFTSPDAQWVGYADNATTLKKVALSGGPPVTLLTMDGASRGATWLPDDTIIFATNNTATGLQRVSAVGGAATVLTRPSRERGEADHLWPEQLPGGQAVLFTILPVTGGLDAAQVAVLDLATGIYKVVVRGGNDAHYAPSGHLVYGAGGGLRALAFDLSRRAVWGTPVLVLPRVMTTPTGGADVAMAADGTLVYIDAAGGGTTGARTLAWVDRQGREQPLTAPTRAYFYPRLSPDGTRVALYSPDQEQDLWIWNLARTTLTRLTSEPGQDSWPVWTPDGHDIVFNSQRASGVSNIFRQAADGTGTAERLTESPNAHEPTAITPDGMHVVFTELTPTMGADLMLLTLRPPRRVTPLLATRFNESNGTVSPDGHWLAYESDSSGRFEIYVRPFPTVGAGQAQVSIAGGMQPLWARGGHELFYVAPDGALLMVPVVARDGVWSAGTPTKVVEGHYVTGANTPGRNYDVSPDGQRFLLLKQAGTDSTVPPPQIIVVQHWDEELKRLVPTK